MKLLLSIFVWIIGAFLALLAVMSCLFFAVALFPFDKQRKIVHSQCFWLADAIVGLSPFWRVSIDGQENIDRTKTYVIVSNHQSIADIIILYKMRMQFKWVAKESLFRVPFVNAFLFLGRHIMLSKCRLSRIKDFYRKARHFLKNGMSLFFFPEGTRSDTGNIGVFQNGAFKMAIEEKVPVLPVFIDGTRNVIRKGSWVLNTRASCRLVVLPPINTAGLSRGDLPSLKRMVYACFENAGA